MSEHSQAYADYVFFEPLNITGFYSEAPGDERRAPRLASTYRLHYVTEGVGFLETKQGAKPVKRGDVIVTPPSVAYAINGGRGLKYTVIGYSGSAARDIAQDFGLDRTPKIYGGLEALSSVWASALTMTGKNALLRCKGIIYCTFSEIGSRSSVSSSVAEELSVAQKIKAFIDDNFTSGDMNLNFISENLSYHPNYISSVFNEEFSISIARYVNILRIHHACFLMDRGMTSLKVIAPLCGYDNVDYFSSVFKAQMGVTPREHIKRLSTTGTTD